MATPQRSSRDRKEWNNSTKVEQEVYESPKRRPNSAKAGESGQRNDLYSSFPQHPLECLCKECICGRHLCKFTSPTPSITLASTYTRHYPPRNPYRNHSKVQPPLNLSKAIENPLLTFSSTYRDHYQKNEGDPLQKPKPDDLLGCKGGPSLELTSYSSQFPGHKGKNQYVPMNPEHPRGGLPFNSSTTYVKEYSRIEGKSAQKAKPPDQFSMTGSWLGGSSYRDQYQNPKNHVSAPKSRKNSDNASNKGDKSVDLSLSAHKNPSSHFQTTYKNDYIRNNFSTICPAARIIDLADLSKSNFKQNSHFKGMDSRYVSLAKHSSFQ